MKKKGSFWWSLEKYGWAVARRSTLPWQWVGIGVVVSIFVVSIINVKNSVVGAGDLWEVIERAAERGDYELAEELFSHYTKEPLNHLVLGANSELENKIFPERVVEQRIRELETKLGDYPGNREIFITLAKLYREIGDTEKTQEYFEKARVLDPNDPIFQP